MRLLAAIISAAFLSVAYGVIDDNGNYRNPRRSPKQALNIYLTPFINSIETWDAIPGCQAVNFTASDILDDPLMWQWSGLERFARLARKEVSERALTRPHAEESRSRREKASKAASAKKFDTTPDNVGPLALGDERDPQYVLKAMKFGESPHEPVAEAVATSPATDFLPDLHELGDLVQCVAKSHREQASEELSAAICSCAGAGGSAEQFCALRDGFALTVACHDEMAKRVDKRRWCPALLQANRGVILPERCAGSVAGDLDAVNMDLNQVNFPQPTPTQIDPTTSKEELRSYWVAFKAIERLTRWADAHLFCYTAEGDNPTLDDFAPLDNTWESKIYFWMQELDGRRIPFAVLAQRVPDTNSTTPAVDTSLLLIRDVKTTFEGRIALADEFSRALHPDDTVLVHGGADAVAQMMVPALRNFLAKHLQKTASRSPRMLTVAYGQLGGAVGAIVALEMARQLPSKVHEKFQVRHDAILFAPGNVGDFNFVTELATKVNIRAITAPEMSLRHLPCESNRACGGEYIVPTGATGGQIGPYLFVRGRVNVPFDRLPHDAWKENVGLYATASRTCAIKCWLATEYCVDDPKAMCSPHDCLALDH